MIDWTDIANKLTKIIIKTFKELDKISNYKISKLMKSKLKDNLEEVIHTLSSYNLSTTEKLLLCKGLDFVLPQ